MASNRIPLRRTRTRTRRLRALSVLGSALIALTLATGPASATIVDRHNESGPYEFTAWDLATRCRSRVSSRTISRFEWTTRTLPSRTSRIATRSRKRGLLPMAGRSLFQGTPSTRTSRRSASTGSYTRSPSEISGQPVTVNGLVRQGSRAGPRGTFHSSTRSTSRTASGPIQDSGSPDLTPPSTWICA